MQRYSGFVRYPVLFLAVLHALSGGHVVCHAHFVPQPVATPSASCAEYDCCHPHDQVPEDRQPACCCLDDFCNGEHPCNSNEQPAIVAPRSVNESVDLFQIPLGDFISQTSAPLLTGFRGIVTVCPSAPPVRLHLFYRSLLI